MATGTTQNTDQRIYYDWNGKPAYREGEHRWNVYVVTDGKAQVSYNTAAFMQEAYRVSKSEYDKITSSK